MIRTAPIVLFVYNRLDHTQRTIESLKANLLSEQSELYIFSDAAKDVDAIPSVEILRSYLNSITGFKNIHICLRETNLGVDENIILGVTQIVNIYGRVIVLEDDLVTSPWFLTFMNEGLERYELNREVASIHGYTYPVKQKLKESFFLKGADCWGWATWKREWNLFEYDGSKLLNRMVKYGLQKEFDFNNAYPYFNALKEQAIGNTKEWDIRWYASAFLANKLTLYPGESLVQNIGNDGSGIHCGDNNIYDVTLAQSRICIETDVEPDSKAYNIFADFLRENVPRHVNKNWLSRSFKRLKAIPVKLFTRGIDQIKIAS